METRLILEPGTQCHCVHVSYGLCPQHIHRRLTSPPRTEHSSPTKQSPKSKTSTALDSNGDVVRHLDGDKENNRAENLAWGTDSENMIDQVRHGNHLHARKAHCPRGHELVMPNLVRAIWVQRSNRSCLACSRARDMARCRPIDLQVESDSHHRRILAADEERR